MDSTSSPGVDPAGEETRQGNKQQPSMSEAWRKSDLGPLNVRDADPVALMKADRMAASDARYKPVLLDAEGVAKIRDKWRAKQSKHMSAAAPLFGYRESVAHILREKHQRGIGASPGVVSAPAADYSAHLGKTSAADQKGNPSSNMHGERRPGYSTMSSSSHYGTASDGFASSDATAVAWGGRPTAKRSTTIETARSRYNAILKSFQSKSKLTDKDQAAAKGASTQ
jgi:hypothetical protein